MDVDGSLHADTRSWHSHLKRQRVPKRYMDDLIMEYFVVEGDEACATAFAHEAGFPTPTDSMEGRVAIRNAILAGRVEEAVTALNRLDEQILASNAKLRFQVFRQKFLELVRAGDVGAALDVATTALLPLTEENPALLPDLEKAMALLAFPKPQRSPLGSLLGANQREETARAVNSAILTAVGHPTESRMPVLLKMLLRSQKRLRTLCTYPEITNIATGQYQLPSVSDTS